MGSMYVRPYWLDKDYVPGTKYRTKRKSSQSKKVKGGLNGTLELLQIKPTTGDTAPTKETINRPIQQPLKSTQLLQPLYKNTKTKKECLVSDAIAKLLNGTREVECYPVGRIDVLTDVEVIEVKEDNWKHAIGQVLIYGHFHPDKTKVIYLFGKNAQYYFTIACEHCKRLNIDLRIFNP